MWHVHRWKLERRTQPIDDHSDQSSVRSDLSLQSLRGRSAMSEAALVIAKYLFQLTVEKLRMKTKHIGTRLNKITRRLSFLSVLAKRNEGTRPNRPTQRSQGVVLDIFKSVEYL